MAGYVLNPYVVNPGDTLLDDPYWPIQNPSYLSVIPNVVVYGTETAAGANLARNNIAADASPGTRILYVDRLGDSVTDGGTPANHGTLRWCLNQHNTATSGGTTIVFKISGTIESSGFAAGTIFSTSDTTKNLVISRGRLTIAGQTAPSPGIQIKGMGFNIRASDILIQHLRIRPGAGPADGVEMSSTTERVIIDHCSIQYAWDEAAAFFNTVRNSTFVSCLLSDSIGLSGTYRATETVIAVNGQSYNTTDSNSTERCGLHRCYIAAAGTGMPNFYGTSGIYTNNIFNSWGYDGANVGATVFYIGRAGSTLEPANGSKLTLANNLYSLGVLSSLTPSGFTVTNSTGNSISLDWEDLPDNINVNAQIKPPVQVLKNLTDPKRTYDLWISGCRFEDGLGRLVSGFSENDASFGDNQWQFTDSATTEYAAGSINEAVALPNGQVMQSASKLRNSIERTVGCRPLETRDRVDRQALGYLSGTSTPRHHLINGNTQSDFISYWNTYYNSDPWPTTLDLIAESNSTSTSTSAILWKGDFETGTFLKWHRALIPEEVWYWGIPSYGRPPRHPSETSSLPASYYGDGSLLRLVTSPVRTGGTYAAEFTVKNSINGSADDYDGSGTQYVDSTKRRTELWANKMLSDSYNAIPYQQSRWVSVSHFVPADWDSGGSGWGPIVMQMKPRNESGLSPAIAIELQSYGWELHHRWDDAVDPSASDVPWQQQMYYNANYPTSTDWPDGLTDFPNVTASRAALASIGKGEWTDWIINLRGDARGASQGGTGFIRIWKRQGNGPWVEVLYITPKQRTRGGITFDCGVMYNSPAGINNGGYGVQVGLYMNVNQVWGLPNNRKIVIDNVKVGDSTATFAEMTPEGLITEPPPPPPPSTNWDYDPIPASAPNEIMPSGYTRLEEWLHRRSAEVEPITIKRIPTPTNFRIVSSNPSTGLSANLDWDDVPDESSSDPVNFRIVSGTESSIILDWDDSDLVAPSVPANFRVVNVSESLLNLSLDWDDIEHDEIVDITAPSIPSGLSADAVSTSRIDLTWTASTDDQSGVRGYYVRRSLDNQNWTELPSLITPIETNSNAIVWNPGHYGYDYTEFETKQQKLNKWDYYIGPYNNVKGVMVEVNWSQLEGDTRGDYSPGIALIGDYLNHLVSMPSRFPGTSPRRLAISFRPEHQNRRLVGSGTQQDPYRTQTTTGVDIKYYPQYLLNGGHIVEYQDNVAGTTMWFVNHKYDSVTRQYLYDMWEGIANGLKSHPYYEYIELIRPFHETITIRDRNINGTASQISNPENFVKEYCLHLRNIFPTKNIFWPENDTSRWSTLNDVADYMEDIQVGWGLVDSLPRGANGTLTGGAQNRWWRGDAETFWNNVSIDRRGTNARFNSVENSELGFGTFYTYAAQEIFDFENNNQRTSHLFWPFNVGDPAQREYQNSSNWYNYGTTNPGGILNVINNYPLTNIGYPSNYSTYSTPGGSGNIFSDTNLSPGTLYYYQVKAVDNSNNQSGWSASVSATTQTTQPVTNGMILYLDAGNPNSYAGSGTTWRDLSPSGANFTLNNGPAFSAPRSISFDGVNDFATSNSTAIQIQDFNVAPNGDRTLEIWFKVNGPVGTRDAALGTFYGNVGCLFGDQLFTNGMLRLQDNAAVNTDGSGNSYRAIWSWDDSQTTDAYTNTILKVGEWNQLVVLLTQFTASYYINGVLDREFFTSTDLGVSPVPQQATWSLARSNRGSFSSGTVATNLYLKCDVSIVRQYNRVLSPAEILQNYNADSNKFLIDVDKWQEATPNYLSPVKGLAGYAFEGWQEAGLYNNINFYRVTNLNKSGPGSLKYGVEENWTGLRIIVFEVSGLIDMTTANPQPFDDRTDTINCNKPNLIIAGQTAPAGGIWIKGKIAIAASRVILWHVGVLRNMLTSGTTDPAAYGDTITIYGPTTTIENIALVNVLAYYGQDETIDAFLRNANVSIVNSMISFPIRNPDHHLDEGSQTTAVHDYGIIFGDVDRSQVSRSIISNAIGRMPLSRSMNTLVDNNLIYNWGWNATQIYKGSSTPKYAYIQSNLYVVGPFRSVYNGYQQGIDLQSVNSTDYLTAFVDGNRSLHTSYSDELQSNFVIKTGTATNSIVVVDTIPTGTGAYYPEGHNTKTIGTGATDRQDFANLVMSTVGPRPLDRISLQNNLINQIQNGINNPPSGTWVGIDDPEAIGSPGYPSFTPVTRTFTIGTGPGQLPIGNELAAGAYINKSFDFLNYYTDLVTPSYAGTILDTTKPTAPTNFSISSIQTTQFTLTWTAATDNVAVVGYRLERSTDNVNWSNTVYSGTQTTFTDNGLTPNTRYYYRLRAFDQAGNNGDWVSTSATTASAIKTNSILFLQAGNNLSYSGSGTVWNDLSAANNDGNLVNAPVFFNAGAGSYFRFNGTNQGVTTTVQYNDPQVFTLSVWFRTSVASGRKIIGFESPQTGTTSTAWDRQIYINTTGKVVFGVYDEVADATRLLTSLLSYNDGQWHNAVVTFNGNNAAGTNMNLYIDGVLIVSGSSVRKAETNNGWWRIGFFQTNGWPGALTGGGYWTGDLGMVAVYNVELNAATVKNYYDELKNVYVQSVDNTPPTIPTGVSASATSSSSITVFWSQSTDTDSGVASYSLRRSTDQTNWTVVNGITSLSYVQTGLNASTTYFFQVQARDNAGNVSAWSATAQATTLSTSVNPIIFNGDFETGNLDGYSVSGNAPTITTLYVRDGRFAIESRLNRLNSPVSYRTEVRARAPDPVIDSVYWNSVGQEYWYGFSIYVPTPFVADNIWEVVAQFHSILDADDAASGLNPPLSFEIAGSQWRIINRYSLLQPTTNRTTAFDQRVGDVEPGRWTDWVVNVRWSATAGVGFLRIWKNGVIVVDITGPNTYNDQRGPYFKMGIYKGWRDRYTPEGVVNERVYYHDAFKMAGPDGSYAAVAPRREAVPHNYPRIGYYWIGGASLGGFTTQYGTETGINLMASSDIMVINGWELVWGARSGPYRHHQAFIAEAKNRASKDTKVVMYFDSDALLPQSAAPTQITAANTNNWYLYQNGTSGTKLTSYFGSGYFAANITDFTPIDGATGLRYNEWNAKYQLDWAKNGLYGNQASPALDGLYIDNCFVPKVRGARDPTQNNATVDADWNRDGTSDSSAVGAPSIGWYRQGIRRLALKIKSLNPDALVTGNMGEIFEYGMPSEWSGLFDGGIIEWAIGPAPICPEAWYFSNNYGTSPSSFVNALQIACSAVNDERLQMVHCVPQYQFTPGAARWQYNDPYYFREMRHGLALTLVCTNSAYAFDGSAAQSATDTFPEFSFNLGQPVSGAAGAKQTAPNQNGIWRRDFDNGIVIWCPKTFTGTINLGGTFYVLRGTFTSNVNGTVIQNSTVRDSSVVGLQPGQAVTSLNFSNVMAGYTGARDGFVLSRTPT